MTEKIKLGKCESWATGGFTLRDPVKRKCGKKAVKTIVYQGKSMKVCKTHSSMSGGTW